MNTKKITVIAVLGILLLAFLWGMNTYQRQEQETQTEKASLSQSRLVRMHSPVFGAVNAPVTIVEFFDPACETCRAFYPIVKKIMGQYPNDVRLVLRYAPFHEGSEEAVKLLEAAKKQGLYQPVLEALLDAQPIWASHDKPNIQEAWAAAQKAGLDVVKARADAQASGIAAVLTQDVEDLKALDVKRTPTFFVNGQALASFGEQQLADLVRQEVAKVKK